MKVSEIAERWAWAWFAAWQKWHDILCHAWSWQKAKRKVARLQMLRCITRARRAAGRKVAARKLEATPNVGFSDAVRKDCDAK